MEKLFKWIIKVSNQKEGWTDELPADSPEDGRSGANHHLHIITEPRLSIEPEHSQSLNKHNKDDGIGWSKHIQHGNQIFTSLN